MKRKTRLLLWMIFSGWAVSAQPFSRECEASFVYSQDPGNHLIVNFTSTSTGDITDLFWDFGDGSTFHGENPSHAYPYTGEYTVCLIISNTDTINPCADTSCQNIKVELVHQYNVGGLLFAGPFPINNPVSTGDTAYAYLYRFEQNTLVPVDSTSFDTLGYFWFPGVTEGKYFLKAGLNESSARFYQFLPAYYGDCLRWTDADTLFVEQDLYNLHITLVPGHDLAAGEGYIRGKLTMDQATGGSQPVEAGQVILTNASGIPYYCTYTEPSGEFYFEDIPVGEYQLFGEYTGKLSEKPSLLLDESNPSVDSLELRLYNAIQGAEDPLTAEPVDVTLFPNPADDFLHLRLTLKHPEYLQIAVYNTMGRLMTSAEWSLPSGIIQQALHVADLPPAIYLVAIRDIRSDWVVLNKFIKN